MLRWGLLGTGFISNATAEAIGASDGSVIRAIAGRNPDAVAEFQNKYDIPVAAHGFDDVINNLEIDVIYIGVPNHVHHTLSIAAAKQGNFV